MVKDMTHETEIRAFVADWFARFDRLEPIDAFLTDLHPNVVWDMPGIDLALAGHARVRDWYAGVLKTFESPTEHHVSQLEIGAETVSFNVLFRARTHQGDTVEAHVHEDWRIEIRPDGRPLITQYSAREIEREES